MLPYNTDPLAALSSLTVKRQAATSPVPMPKQAPHYSPLQQNNNRAVSPLADTSNAFRGLFTGREVHSTTPVSMDPSSLGIDSLSGLKQNRIFGDSGSMASEDAFGLSGINVKGLSSLASYPNPMQKTAQDKLAKARAANLALQRVTTSVPAHDSLNMGRSAGSLQASVGAPQPLTAGPPGHRQFRPSNFETMARTRSQETSSPTLAAEAKDYLVEILRSSGIGFAQHFGAEKQKEPPMSNEIWSNPAPRMPPSRTDRAVCREANIAYNRAISPVSLKVADRKIPYDTKEPEEVAKWYENNQPPVMSKQSRRKYVENDFAGPASPAIRETIEERRERINRAFYAGTAGITKPIEQVVVEHDDRLRKNPLGTIGDRRGSSTKISDPFRAGDYGRTADRGKPILPHLSVQQANNTHATLHAEPILSMALDSLLRIKNERALAQMGTVGGGAVSRFTPADPAWVDTSPEGNKSFFETEDSPPDAEQQKKKKASRRGRAGRGY